MKLVECVPNISEGRRPEVIAKIVEAAKAVEGAFVLNVDTNVDANRTVITIAGLGEPVLESAFRLTEASLRLIDMRTHRGVHPRIGAVDVCPFVPLKGTTMEECVGLSERYASRTAMELQIPVYLYERSQKRAERRALSDIRRGEYEGLAAKIKLAEWEPDYGPREVHQTFGAAVTGARPFLVAYNVNLKGLDEIKARLIASTIRTSGALKRDSRGELKRISGELPALKAIGWRYEEADLVQVSTNITDLTKNGMHDVYEAVKRHAKEMGGDADGSELIGMVPETALIRAGMYYAPETNSNQELIEAAVESLGLAINSPFDPNLRIIERMLPIVSREV